MYTMKLKEFLKVFSVAQEFDIYEYELSTNYLGEYSKQTIPLEYLDKKVIEEESETVTDVISVYLDSRDNY